jgi:hypothetical protein
MVMLLAASFSWHIKQGVQISMEHAPFLQILNARYSPLGICDHLPEEIREARPAEFRISAPIKVSVVNRLAV